MCTNISRCDSYARQSLAHTFGLDKEVVEKRYGALRGAWGQEWLGKLADDVEEAVPQFSGLFDALWGSTPKAESHDPVWWGVQRPRPHRGKSADPSVAEKIAKAEKAKQAAEAAASAAASAAAAEAAEEAAADKRAEQAVQELDFATMETQKRRLSFFGRPAHKFRINKMKKEIERKAHENQAVMWAHLLSDAQTEYDYREEINKDSRRKKEKAVSAAASYRAEERGARAAVAGLKPWGDQMKKAMLDAKAAEDRYRSLAEEQEQIARAERQAEDQAFELMQRVRDNALTCTHSFDAR